MSLQIGRHRISLPDAETVEAWRRCFDREHCVRIPGFVATDLLDWMRRRLSATPFTEHVHVQLDPPPVDLLMKDPDLNLTFRALFNDARLFDVVERVTGCAPIGCYHSIVYASKPGQCDTWHDDVVGDNRLVAMSTNIGGPYEGGLLQIRVKRSQQIVYEIANTGAGDAILFRVRDDLEHRLTAVEGQRPKMAVAGWFQRQPRALDRLRLAAG